MVPTAERVRNRKQREALAKECMDLVIARSGVSKKEIYADALKRFFNGNMDLLSPAELKKYQSVIL